jgi:hypothetical protein
VDTLLDIGFHILSLLNSTYPSTIRDKSSASYAHALTKNSVSSFARKVTAVLFMVLLELAGVEEEGVLGAVSC